MRKIIVFLMFIMVAIPSQLVFAESKGNIEIGGSYNDCTQIENIFFDGKINLKQSDFETSIEYTLLKSQSNNILNNMNSDASIQSNFYTELLGNNGYGFIAGNQERHRDKFISDDATRLGGGIGKKEIDLKGILSAYMIQAGLFGNSIYYDQKAGMERNLQLIQQGSIEMPIAKAISVSNEERIEIDIDYAKNWKGNNKLRVKSELNDHIDIGISWLLKYKNVVYLYEPRHENIYIVSINSKF